MANKFLENEEDLFLHDYKTKLQEIVQTDKKSTEYEIINEEGPAHDKVFTVEVEIDNIIYGIGSGQSKKEAEQEAAKEALKKLTEKLDATIAYLNVNEAKGVGYCPCCGEECDLLKTIRVNDVYVSLDDKCYNEVAKVAAVEEQQYNEQPNNFLKGFLGALLGAGIGAAAWVALYYIGFLSALTAVLAVFLGNYFYVKFGGKANNVKNIIVAGVSLVVLVLACVGIYYVEVGSVIAANNLNMTPFELIFSDEELKDFFSEITYIYKAGARITILECDAKITANYEYNGKWNGKVHGRGGTSFQPVIDYYRHNMKDYSALVYFTDGECTIPDNTPRDTIWVITSSGYRQEYPGRVLYIPDKNK